MEKKLFKLDLQFFAQKKAGGSAKTNRSHDSNSKRRGVKKHDGDKVEAGMIIRRQLGSEVNAGKNVYCSKKDRTLHALKKGIVKYYKKIIYKGSKKVRKKITFAEVLEI
ncbi:50S ribosomal protein L27 [endosymbiont GvMRE of Glomus versiforme]|uniref:50S ribosomal protein L27 n=1 Tax=endosymbiont GvMRE of Glomus versiforme TaxID=2039283 RepID=UPI000ECE02DE|nr:50S ribosomal protein L27 [endosymbiont GvMRE of Glomus versiforme]RHZ36853.1 50S ribosomal protein L27 [endosymbiont GvMRE of Glomus versiforme]